MNLRVPLIIPQGRKLRVVIYARYSTSEQDGSSIAAQVRFCKEFLEALGVEAEITVLSDEEMSGELRDRPGINEVRAGIDAKRWDLLLSEDSSRLFRNHSACFELVETAYDNDIRVICINDFVDTAEPDWDARLNEAQRHHCEANRFTRHRIARSKRELWESGAAVGHLLPGYRRKPTIPATEKEPEKGPFFDEIDPEEEKRIFEAYERAARNDPPWLCAQWASESGLRKCGSVKSKEYTEKNFIALIRRTIYRGVETHRVKITKKKLRTGKKRVVRNNPEEIWTRQMPHLREVPDWLWFKANEAISNRRRCKNNPQGPDHPLYGTTRDSRGPLADIFICDICKEKMYKEGRIEGGYRCKNAKNCDCWNKATSLYELTHKQISKAICGQLLAVGNSFEALVELVSTTSHDDTPLRNQLQELQRQEQNVWERCQKLAKAIESTDAPPETLVQMLQEREAELRRIRCQMEELTTKLNEKRPPPTREELERSIREASEKLLTMDREAGVILRKLIDGKILAVPYQQFGSAKVVLRAHFRLQLAKILPDDLHASLIQGREAPCGELLPPIDMVVDLFEPTDVPAHAVRAWELAKQGSTLIQIGSELGLSKRVAHLAKQMGKAMEEANVTDPYVRLTKAPEQASRWRFNRKKKDDDQSSAA